MSPITWAVVLLAGLAGVCSLGTETDIYSNPSIAQIEDLVAVVWLQQCVGSILTSRDLVSAASCFIDEIVANRRIRAGASQRGVGGTVREIQYVIKHPSYGQLDNDGDIAIIRLVTPLTLGPSIQQASILGQGITLPVNLPVSLVSWGTTAEGGLVGNDYLYKLNLYIVHDELCMEKYLTATNPQIITENMICSGLTYNSGRDIDSRDYGAPLFYDGVTVALMSFGISRGDDQYPIVSTAISSYTNWIVETATN